MRKLFLILDDGHGMETAGKRSPITGMRENEFNSSVVEHLKELCKLNSIDFLEVAPTDSDTPLNARTAAANKWYKGLQAKHGKDIACAYLSIHANAGGGISNTGTGVEAWVYSKPTGDALTLGSAITAELAKLGLKNRGVKRGYPGAPNDNFAVNRDTTMTSVLIEHAFMDNKADAALLIREDFRKNCAIADMTAVMLHYGFGRPIIAAKVEDKPDTPTKPQKPKRGYYRMGLFDENTKNQADVQAIVKLMKATGRAIEYVEID